MEVPSTIYIAAGAIIAAFITGFFSFVNLIIAKEQKISEFRQQWIDSLRDDISEFTSQTEFIASMFDHMRRNTPKKLEDPEEVKKFVESISGNIRESINMYHRIQLRVNREEHSKLLNQLHDLYNLWENEGIFYVDKAHALLKEIIKESQDVLKKEWQQVKRGEAIFRVTKYFALSIVLIVLLFVIVQTISCIIL